MDYRYYNNVRGFRITGDLSDNFSFETRFYENQFFYPLYLQKKSSQRANPQMGVDGIAYGIGRAKRFKDYGHDASLANGYLSFSPISEINFQNVKDSKWTPYTVSERISNVYLFYKLLDINIPESIKIGAPKPSSVTQTTPNMKK